MEAGLCQNDYEFHDARMMMAFHGNMDNLEVAVNSERPPNTWEKKRLWSTESIIVPRINRGSTHYSRR